MTERKCRFCGEVVTRLSHECAVTRKRYERTHEWQDTFWLTNPPAPEADLALQEVTPDLGGS